MKINLLVLALASILLSSPVMASRVHIDFDDSDDQHGFSFSDYKSGFEFKSHGRHKEPEQSVFEFPGHQNPHNGFELASLRNFHAEGQGLKGLCNATVQVNPVPLPAAGWLFLSGLVGIIGVTRRKKLH